MEINCAGFKPLAQDLERARDRQLSFYEEECEPEFEIARPRGCGRAYDFLIERKFRAGLRVLGTPIVGCSVLEICCGSGMITEKFARSGAIVTGIDFSPAAVQRARERARRYGFAADFLVGDAEKLGFGDRAFDIVAVHDGLHHLDHPEKAIREMARVARKSVLIMDPARAALTRLAVRLAIAVDVEPAGNEVKRLAPEEVAAILSGAGYSDIVWRRMLMYYPHQPSRTFKMLDAPAAFHAFRAAFWILNAALGCWGNKLALAAKRCSVRLTQSSALD
jgi:SAM-dependent methyltransferase